MPLGDDDGVVQVDVLGLMLRLRFKSLVVHANVAVRDGYEGDVDFVTAVGECGDKGGDECIGAATTSAEASAEADMVDCWPADPSRKHSSLCLAASAN